MLGLKILIPPQRDCGFGGLRKHFGGLSVTPALEL